jgi:hypothetical protein
MSTVVVACAAEPKPNPLPGWRRGSSASRMRSSARLGLHAHALLGLLAVHLHRGVGQVADDLFHVLPT